MECRVINNTGKLMRTFGITSQSDPYQFDISALPCGTYLLQIVGKQLMLTEKFQKM